MCVAETSARIEAMPDQPTPVKARARPASPADGLDRRRHAERGDSYVVDAKTNHSALRGVPRSAEEAEALAFCFVELGTAPIPATVRLVD